MSSSANLASATYTEQYPSNAANGYTHQDHHLYNGASSAAQQDYEDDETLDDGEGTARHGFEATDEQLQDLASRYYLYFTDTRHLNAARAKPPPFSPPPDWRAKDKVRIVHGALAVCVRIGFDPPDIIKTSPCARLEAWVDTKTVGKERATEQITLNITKQFESLATSSKAKFTVYMDPAHEDLRKLCVALRRKTRHDRALFYYNGHGVPKPTSSGELWVFNRQYTQYIPVSVADIVGYLGAPSVYIWDCSNAGHIVAKIQELQALPEGKFPAASASTSSSKADPKDPNAQQADSPVNSVPISSIQDIIQLAACQAHETLPMNPDLPADLFTSCITSPIEMSVRFFILHNPLRSDLPLDIGSKIPGTLGDRKTPLGELLWIFTSVTDTIAWNLVPRHLFQRLFRHDLVMAAIFRGFLLAERIMRRYECTPISVPALPSCAHHPLWHSWDLALDRCLAQVPALAAFEKAKESAKESGEVLHLAPVVYSNSYFFADHLSAFATWIEQGTSRTIDFNQAYLTRGKMLPSDEKRTLPPEFVKANGDGASSPVVGQRRRITNGDSSLSSPGHAKHVAVNGHSRQGTGDSSVSQSAHMPRETTPIAIGQLRRLHKTLRVQAEHPEHLPILLQVLLSQVHRLRALMLLCKFLDLGPWAVNMSLSIGIFPYVLRLLQAPGPELRPVLIYIWSRILGIYRYCQEDLAKAAGAPSGKAPGRPEQPFHYFAGVLDPHQQMLVIPNVSEHRAMCAYIICLFMRDYPYGQQLALTSLPPNSRSNVFESSLYHLNDDDPLLRQWSALTIGLLLDDFDEAKGLAVRTKAHSELTQQMHVDPVPEVRAALMFTLGVFIGCTASDLQAGKSNAGRNLWGCATERTQIHEQWQGDEELGVAMACLKMQSDGSPMVRKELVILLSAIVYNHRGSFTVAAYDHAMHLREDTYRNPIEVYEERMATMEASIRGTEGSHSSSSAPRQSTYSRGFRAIMYESMYKTLLDFTQDPFPDVAVRAEIVVDYINDLLVSSDLPYAVERAPTPPSLSEGEDEDSDSAEGTDSTKASFTGGSRTSASPAPSHVRAHLSTVNAQAVARERSSYGSAVKALAKLGLSDPHGSKSETNLSPTAARTGRGQSVLPSSKSVAHLSDLIGGNRGLRHVSSADSLLHTAAFNSASSAANSSKKSSHRSAHTRSGTDTGSDSDARTPAVTVEEAKAMLIQSDSDRHAIKRATPVSIVVTPARTAPPVPVTPNPSTPPPPVKDPIPGPTVSDAQGRPISREMPLRSEFFDWSVEYFTSPQMKEKEADEPGSVEYGERHWRRERNEKIILSTQPLKEAAGSSRWDQLEMDLENVTVPEHIVFHQFESHIAAADSTGTVRVHDWASRMLLNKFQNESIDDERFHVPAKISTVKFVNDDDIALLLVGTADGRVRVWRDYDREGTNIVTGWRAITDVLPGTHAEAGLVCEWQQGRGRLLASGNSKVIRVWEAPTEVCRQEIGTRSSSCVTSLTSDQVAGDVIVAGFGDGTVKVYDTRAQPKENLVRVFKGNHRSWVKDVHMQRGGNRELVSAGLTGEVCLWDIRMDEPVKVIQAHSGGLSALAVHEHAPVFATGSDAGIVKVWNMNTDAAISKFRNADPAGSGPASRRDAGAVHTIKSMMFHPHEMSLAVGATDTRVNIYNCQH